MGGGLFRSIFFLIRNISYSWTEETVNYFHVCTLQWWMAGLLILIEKEGLGEPRALRGGPLCAPHQGHMLCDRGVVELGLATRATIIVEIVIYDITTPGRIKPIWKAVPLRLLKGSQSSSIRTRGTLCGDDFWIYSCQNRSRNVDLVWQRVCSRLCLVDFSFLTKLLQGCYCFMRKVQNYDWKVIQKPR